MTEPDAPKKKWRVPARIETERLVLRPYALDDVPAMDEVIPANRDHLIEFMAWAKDEPIGTEARRAYVEKCIAGFRDGTDLTMGMFLRANGELIGGTGYHVHDDRLEIGYWLAERWQRQGLMTEAAGALTRIALQFSFAPLVEICCDPANERSKGVPKRLGFPLTGTREVDGAPHESWRLTQDAFLDSPASAEPRPNLFDGTGSPLAWPV